MPLNARVYDDGSLVFPERGDIPTVIPGYFRDPGNPYILRPDYPECQHRERQEARVPCNRTPGGFRIEVFHTCKRGFKVSHDECKSCCQSGRKDSA